MGEVLGRFMEQDWVQQTARRLDLQFTLRNPDRPAKRKGNQ